jgi:hypothetical protein
VNNSINDLVQRIRELEEEIKLELDHRREVIHYHYEQQ